MTKPQCGFRLKTDGEGLWNRVSRTVLITDMELRCFSDDFGELRVFFDTDNWNTEKHGLIYTDREWLAGLHRELRDQGLSDDVCYSEQGMQGYDYVSLDVDKAFIQSWRKLFA